MKGVIVEIDSQGEPYPKVVEMPTPVRKKNEALVKIKATCLGPSCLDTYHSKRKRKKKKDVVASGIEFSGIIESSAGNFKKGDEVVGAIDYMNGIRTHAEYTVIPEQYLSLKPSTISHPEAASMIIGFLTAIEALIRIGKVKKDSSVLIHGANGSVGIYAIQIANYLGCNVTATAGIQHHETIKQLGAKIVIDYKDNFLGAQKFNLIFDAAGKLNFKTCKNHLTKNGTFITSQPLNDIPGLLRSSYSRKKWKFLYVGNSGKNRMNKWTDLIEKQAVKPMIDRTFKLDEFSQAIQYYKSESVLGKVVIEV